MIMGGQYDPVTKQMATTFEGLTLELQREAYETAKRMVRERLPVIKSIANDLCEAKSATVQGVDIIQRIQSVPIVPVEVDGEAPSSPTSSWSSGRPGSASFRQGEGGESSFREPKTTERSGGPESADLDETKVGWNAAFKEKLRAELRLPAHLLEDAIAVLSGQADEATFPGFVSNNGSGSSVSGPNTEMWENQMRRFATSPDAPFPISPPVPELTKEFIKHSSLYDWANKARIQQPDAEVEVLRL
jgi:hypothetical protein